MPRAARTPLVADIEITVLRMSAATCAQLSEVLIEVVADGGSVSFMHPLDPAAAQAYWEGALAAAGRDEQVILGAWDGDLLAGTVTLLVDLPPNQRHRAEVAKLMTRPGHRGRGIATSLMQAVETIAVELGEDVAGARHGGRGGSRFAVPAAGIHADRRDPRLRTEAAWRIDGHAGVLEANRPAWTARSLVIPDAKRPRVLNE